MNRSEAKELLPIIQAFAEGKEIEGLYKGTKSPWFKIKDMDFNEGIIFRIKPEPKYRQFKNAEECWNEMMKHQPLGWVKDKKDGHHALITAVDDDDTCGTSLNGNAAWSLYGIMDLFNFADGVPFGVKIEDDYNGIKIDEFADNGG